VISSQAIEIEKPRRKHPGTEGEGPGLQGKETAGEKAVVTEQRGGKVQRGFRIERWGGEWKKAGSIKAKLQR